MELANILSECLRNPGSWNPNKFPMEACPPPLLALVQEIGQSLSYRSAPKGYRTSCGVFKLSSLDLFIFCVFFFSFLYFLFGTLQITRMLAQSSLFRKLGKVVLPVFLRKKHDYFPRTLKLHNGKKVRNIYQYWTLNLRNSLDLQDEENGFQLHFFFGSFILKCYACLKFNTENVQ